MKLVEDKSAEIEQTSKLAHAKVHELYEIGKQKHFKPRRKSGRLRSSRKNG